MSLSERIQQTRAEETADSVPTHLFIHESRIRQSKGNGKVYWKLSRTNNAQILQLRQRGQDVGQSLFGQ